MFGHAWIRKFGNGGSDDHYLGDESARDAHVDGPKSLTIASRGFLRSAKGRENMGVRAGNRFHQPKAVSAALLSSCNPAVGGRKRGRRQIGEQRAKNIAYLIYGTARTIFNEGSKTPRFKNVCESENEGKKCSLGFQKNYGTNLIG